MTRLHLRHLPWGRGLFLFVFWSRALCSFIFLLALNLCLFLGLAMHIAGGLKCNLSSALNITTSITRGPLTHQPLPVSTNLTLGCRHRAGTAFQRVHFEKGTVTESRSDPVLITATPLHWLSLVCTDRVGAEVRPPRLYLTE